MLKIGRIVQFKGLLKMTKVVILVNLVDSSWLKWLL